MNKNLYYIKYYSYSVSYSTEEAHTAECIELGIMADGEIQEEATKIHLMMLEEDGKEVSQPLTSQNAQSVFLLY